jgi:hypothetical protein
MLLSETNKKDLLVGGNLCHADDDNATDDSDTCGNRYFGTMV